MLQHFHRLSLHQHLFLPVGIGKLKQFEMSQVSEVMRAQEKRLGDAEHLNHSLLVRCKSVEALATELTAELQKEKRELTSIMRRQQGVDSSMDASTELNGYLQGRLASARRREEKVEEDMAALKTSVEAASSVQVSSHRAHTIRSDVQTGHTLVAF